MVREEEREKVRVRARELAEERLLDLLLPPPPQMAPTSTDHSETREKLRTLLRDGKLDDRTVNVEVTKPVTGPMIEVMSPQGMEDIQSSLKDMFENLLPKKTKTSRVRVPEALDLLAQEEATRLIDMDAATKEALRRVEQ